MPAAVWSAPSAPFPAEARKAAAGEDLGTRSRWARSITGVVKSLTSYGAFVDIGGVDGMVHVSELSWNRIKTPR